MRRHHVTRLDPATLAVPADHDGHCRGFGRVAHVDGSEGSVHTGFATCELQPGGELADHVHSYEESFYVLSGAAELTVDGRTVRVTGADCGLVAVGAPHRWRNGGDAPVRWLEMSSPTPRAAGSGAPPDTFWVPAAPDQDAIELDIRDPRTRGFFRLGPDQMDVDQLKLGAQVEAPTVSASMATALLAYSGIAVKMLVDERLGAALHNMFMVEYQAGGVAHPHDHPLEETYYMLEGSVEFVADGETYDLGPGDVAWAGVGCVHAFYHRSGPRPRWLETQAPLPPRAHSYRFNRDWDYLQSALEGT